MDGHSALRRHLQRQRSEWQAEQARLEGVFKRILALPRHLQQRILALAVRAAWCPSRSRGAPAYCALRPGRRTLQAALPAPVQQPPARHYSGLPPTTTATTAAYSAPRRTPCTRQMPLPWDWWMRVSWPAAAARWQPPAGRTGGRCTPRPSASCCPPGSSAALAACRRAWPGWGACRLWRCTWRPRASPASWPPSWGGTWRPGHRTAAAPTRCLQWRPQSLERSLMQASTGPADEQQHHGNPQHSTPLRFLGGVSTHRAWCRVGGAGHGADGRAPCAAARQLLWNARYTALVASRMHSPPAAAQVLPCLHPAACLQACSAASASWSPCSATSLPRPAWRRSQRPARSLSCCCLAMPTSLGCLKCCQQWECCARLPG